MISYETVKFESAHRSNPNYEGESTGFLSSRESAIEQFDLILKVMVVHNGSVTERGNNDDGLPFAVFSDGSGLETYLVVH